MKKLFISCPMNGRTEENIKASMHKMHQIAEAYVGEELEVLNTYFADGCGTVKNAPVQYLGRAIQMMADADYFICVNDSYEWRGCFIESEVAMRYGIPVIMIEPKFILPDVIHHNRFDKYAPDGENMTAHVVG